MPAIVNPCVDDFSGLAFQVVSNGYRSSLNVMTEVDEGVEIHCNGDIDECYDGFCWCQYKRGRLIDCARVKPRQESILISEFKNGMLLTHHSVILLDLRLSFSIDVYFIKLNKRRLDQTSY
mmetsp:Transcript_17789/g.35649  ORF Transcript_17789/g.35649 Transcript_17789/m.35649 type:complete len:121 (+) Transcript_17789:980-1342(+)